MSLLALKVDVDTYRGTRQGVPRLVERLRAHDAGASFLFSLGPDHTGRAMRRAFRRGFMKKVSRTSVLRHYGLKTLLYGTLLPGPDIGETCREVLRSVRAAGFETGVHAYDHVKWQDYVGRQNAAWTEKQLMLAVDRYTGIFGEAPRVHGAAGWQTNIHALRLAQRLGFNYCSDSRGAYPFMPIMRGEIIACPQLPTTLPTLDELIGADGLTEDNVHLRLLELTCEPPATGHVYTLHAELEGMALAPVFERLLEGWRAQGYRLVAMQDLFETLDRGRLPRHEIVMAEIAGRSGILATQGEEFLAEYGP